MTEAIQAVAMEAAKAAPATAPVAQPQTGAFEVHQFSDAYARSGATAATNQAQGVAQAAPPSEGLRAFAAFADNINGGASNIEALTQKMSSSEFASKPSAMLEVTMACQQFMFKAQLTSNVANRTSDGIQQLFRQQS
jgi:hypothetical protein